MNIDDPRLGSIRHGRKIPPVSATLLVILIGVFSFPVSAGAVEKVFLLRGSGLHVLDVETGNPIVAVSLEGIAGDRIYRRIEPTPGGKVLFLWDTGFSSAITVDHENPRDLGTVDFEGSPGAGALVFSPMGDRLYVSEAQGGRIDIYTHQAGKLSERIAFDAPTSADAGTGRISLNRRGTRFYRSGPSGLVYYLTTDFSVLETVGGAAGGRDWTTAPGGRYLWGMGPNDVVVVDEPRGVVKATLPVSGSVPPLFDTDGRTGYLLADGGRTLVILDPRRVKETRRVDLPEPIRGIGLSKDGVLWAAGDNRLYKIQGGTIESRIALPGSGSVFDLALVELKPGQGFACF